MSSDSHVSAEQHQAVAALPPEGVLQIELPHWSAAVRIYNSLLQLMPAALLHAIGRPARAGQYLVEATLPAGVYEIEVSLGDHRQRQTAAVHAGQTRRVTRDLWRNLQFTSAVPLASHGHERSSHVRNAEKWSRQITWPNALGGDSRLFIFVRTEDPRAYRRFAEGLAVLDGDANPVCDLSIGSEKNARSGWLAFAADLPPGYYILRRGRSGVRIRQQPIYLCAGWETQVFIAAHSTPSLRTLSLNMARKGAGFQADDETALASEIVLDSLGRSEGSRSVVARSKIGVLLEDKLENPWLGILGAYALRHALDQARASDDQAELMRRYRHVMSFLQMIGEHPDVRALNLVIDQPAGPFWQPPLLRAGLNWVQEHATRHASTVPVDSLTDIVLDNVVVNSPWTAWRKLDRTPRPAGSQPQTTGRIGKQGAVYKQAPAFSPSFTYAAQIQGANAAQADPLAAPPGEETTYVQTKGIGSQAERGVRLTRDALQEASLVQVTQSLSQMDNLDALQETVAFNPSLDLQGLLNSISAQEVSSATGLPLARTEQTLEDLRRAGADEGAQDVLDSPLTVTERVILDYALSAASSAGRTGYAAPAAASLPEPAAAALFTPEAAMVTPQPQALPSADDLQSAANAPADPPLPLRPAEEYVMRLRADADRLALAAPDGKYTAEALALAERLHRVANRLLLLSDFSVRTDLAGRLQQPNTAFMVLLTPPGAQPDAASARRERQAIQKRWEEALAAASPGRSLLPHPVPQQPFPAWNLQRTAILDERDRVVQAYLYVLRSSQPMPPAAAILPEVEAQLSELALYASLCAYGATQSASSLDRLYAVLQRLEEAASQ